MLQAPTEGRSQPAHVDMAPSREARLQAEAPPHTWFHVGATSGFMSPPVAMSQAKQGKQRRSGTRDTSKECQVSTRREAGRLPGHQPRRTSSSQEPGPQGSQVPYKEQLQHVLCSLCPHPQYIKTIKMSSERREGIKTHPVKKPSRGSGRSRGWRAVRVLQAAPPSTSGV